MQAHFLCIANTLRVICITCKHGSSANSESTLFSTAFRDAAAGCSRLHYAIIHYEGGGTLSSAGSPQARDRLCISSHHHNAAMRFLHWLYSTVTVSLVHHVHDMPLQQVVQLCISTQHEGGSTFKLWLLLVLQFLDLALNVSPLILYVNTLVGRTQ